MAKGISGTALTAGAVGALLLWSSLKGRSWSNVVRELISGEKPSNSQENAITLAAGAADTGATSPGTSTSGLSGNKKIVNMIAASYGWGTGAQWDALVQIVNHESGFNNTAQNPTSSAYGMFQFLDPTWADYGGKKTSDPTVQAQLGLKYIKARYGDPIKAWSFWQSHHWY